MQFDTPTIEAARDARDIGMQQALDHAERVQPDWKREAYAALVAFAESHAQFTSEDFRAGSSVSSPTTPKAFGPVFKRAARAGVIVKRGFTTAKERHLSPCPLWESLVYREAA